MASLITHDYFIRNVTIAQISQPAVSEAIDDLLAVYEPDMLNALLGVDLYAALLAGLEAPVVDPKWTDLLNGGTYTDRAGRKTIWHGLANLSRLTSPIANYIYYQYARQTASWSAGAGEVLPTLMNGERFPAANKMATIWNDMVDMNYRMVGYLNENAATYPEWEPIPWNSGVWVFGESYYWWPVWYWNYGLCNGMATSDLFTKINAFNL